ncbi:DNA cytosine methyltransferase [Oceanidesulfovibrio marinus]|uniref:DNA (cytosine-5-)-methyltransferase n=1 Tax=Oceanidesulfovibrio marinus TaxID=370038 RepID=A0A6P1ZGB1_9BACT|nr:DNA cytosine methyltransferase [Oceanidesulfovibrio marinus]TVM33675.1 modification methylase NmeDIP [Oceanidesulfovibrio marinus]
MADIFSFFSGLGFLDLGFEDSGFNVKLVNEYHRPFIEAYKFSRAHMERVLEHDVTYVCDDVSVFFNGAADELESMARASRIQGNMVGFVGGPPCPDFSIGGKNKGFKGENGRLTHTFSELIYVNEPDFFVFENVKGLFRTKKHRAFYESIKKKLSAKYLIDDKLINSIEFGAPQDRDRIFMIGIRRDIAGDNFNAENGQFVNWDRNKVYPSRSAFEYPWPQTDDFVEGSTTEIPKGLPRELTVQHWFEQNNVVEHFNQRHHFMPRNGLSRFMSVPEGDDRKKSFKRLHRWRYSPTACYGNNEVHLHPYFARRISAAEALAIQTLPQNFILPERMTLTNMFKGIGNGVPYLMSRGIAMNLSESLNSL